MQQFFFNLLARLLPTSTVDRAVRAITRAAAALQAAEAAQNARADGYRTQAQDLLNAAAAADVEASRARRVADRLTNLTA